MSREEDPLIAGQRKKRMLSFMFSKRVPPVPSEEDRQPFPKPSFLSSLNFSWLDPILVKGYKRTLEKEDLYYLTDDWKVEKAYNKFVLVFKEDFNRKKQKHLELKSNPHGEREGSPSVKEDDEFVYPRLRFAWLIYRTFWVPLTVALLMKLMGDTASVLAPLIQKLLINFISEKASHPEIGIGKGIAYSLGVTLVMLVGNLLNEHCVYRCAVTGCFIKSIITRLVLEKSFNQSEKSKHDFPPGKVTSIMGGDLSRMEFSIIFFITLVVLPVPLLFGIGLLLANIGISALFGLIVFLTALAIITWLPSVLHSLRTSASKYADERVSLVSEVIQNFRMIKFYSWEDAYTDRISKSRDKEMKTLYTMQVLESFTEALSLGLPGLCSMTSFFVLHALKGTANAGSVFSSLNLFGELSSQISMVPMSLGACTSSWVGLGRVVAFLSSGEASEEQFSATPLMIDDMKKTKSAIKAINADFEWMTFEAEIDDSLNTSTIEGPQIQVCDPQSKDGSNSSVNAQGRPHFPGLHNVNIDIRQGEFVVVTGMVGSGKSSLLAALAGFMPRIRGHVATTGDTLLCANHWMQNATVKDNILFGSPFDRKRYTDVIRACALDEDLRIFAAGDETEIGEKGITLSGGQKARLSLARAVYANKDIILLDDVLSAVDARVGKHIVDNCILGLLRGKTRVLATHQLSLISSASRVIFLNGDGSMDVGTGKELERRSAGFNKLMKYHVSEKLLDHQAEEREESEEITKTKNSAGGRLMQDEDRAVGYNTLSVLKRYIELGQGNLGWIFSFFVLLVTVCAGFLEVWVSTWLSIWLSDSFHRDSSFYMNYYVLFNTLHIALLSLEFAVALLLTNHASKMLNIRAIQRVTKVPMSFIDTTPLGRIMNRFTKDTDVLDSQFPDCLRYVLMTACRVIAPVMLCIYFLPPVAIAIPVVFLFYLACASFFRPSYTEIRRIESLQRSFVFSSFSESIQGIEVIKAYKAYDRFIDKINIAMNHMNEATFINSAGNRWMSVRIKLITSFLILLVTMLSVNSVFKVSDVEVGLMTSTIIGLAGITGFLIQIVMTVLNQLNSVERLQYYAFNIPQEAPHVISERVPPSHWPSHGQIRFKNVSLRYRPELPLVLKNISLEIKPHEKIGICGRTGAGKSSIMTALFRLSEIEKNGQITIDGIDTSQMGLRDLRSHLSIIPQDPVLFRGTLRSNLDPFKELPDNALWDALVVSGLIEHSVLSQVRAQNVGDENLHKFHLMQNVEHDGTNFSLGERQLIALARALLRNSKVLIMDEATSSIDYETDAKIQETIAAQFADCTILCIAHRLKTILNYDRILVLEDGQVAEFDTPHALYSNKESLFRDMCDKSHINEADF